MSYDAVGNLTSRSISFGLGNTANLTESFTYDNLHRVLSRTVNTFANVSGSVTLSESYAYDDNGNLTSKGNVGYYQYNVAGKPNRLAAIWQNSNFTGTQNYAFSYDANGNVLSDSKRSYTYTSFDKPSLITQGTNTTSFSYGPSRQLIKRVDVRSGQTTSTVMVDGLYEQVTLPSGVVEHKYFVGDAVVTKRTGTPAGDALSVKYLLKDHLGSTIAVVNDQGVVVQQFIYDPWGKQYNVYSNTSLMLAYSSDATTKGYTGHEMVNDFDVIHMGGRTYNPVIGRFMQADPHVQEAGNLQNYNRYSYVLNNPMRYTDPTGYFFKGLFFALAKVQMLSTIVSVSLTLFVPGCQSGICAAAFNAAVTFAQTGSLRSAAIGFFAGAASGGGFLNDAIVGGIASSLEGGSFAKGFYTAGFGSVAGAASGKIVGQISNPISKVLVAAVIGGTVSKITGGKFANAAFSAAFATALKADWGTRLKGKLSSPSGESTGEVKYQRTSIMTHSDLDSIPVNGYASRDEAAQAALKLASSSGSENVEYGGAIYEVDKRFYFSNPVTSNEQHSVFLDIQLNVGHKFAGVYHTHPELNGDIWFSTADVQFAKLMTESKNASNEVYSYIGLNRDRSIIKFDWQNMPITRRVLVDDTPHTNVALGILLCQRCY